MTELMIDEFAVTGVPGGDNRVKGLLHRAKHFVMDTEASTFIHHLAGERELIRSLNEFALPPFDIMAITQKWDEEAWGAVGGACETLTIWDHGEFKLFIRPANMRQNVAAVPGWTEAPRGRLAVRNSVCAAKMMIAEDTKDIHEFEREANERWKKPWVEKEKKDALGTSMALWSHRIVIDAFFLVMANPQAYVIDFTDHHRAIRRGKNVKYFARSEIKIDLAKAPKVIRNFSTAARGSPRRHEVRRHFSHRGGDRACEHIWQVDVPDKRWRCECGRLRIARGPYERGDAGKGFVRQHYAITHGDDR